MELIDSQTKVVRLRISVFWSMSEHIFGEVGNAFTKTNWYRPQFNSLRVNDGTVTTAKFLLWHLCGKCSCTGSDVHKWRVKHHNSWKTKEATKSCLARRRLRTSVYISDINNNYQSVLQMNALGTISGDNLGYITRAILRRLLSNAVAVMYFWCEEKKELRFDEIDFKQVLLRN